MNRLTKKCLVGSAMMHGLLLVLVIVGSAFVPRKETPRIPTFDLVPLNAMLVNEELVGGGNPNAVPNEQQAGQPQLPQPQPEAKPEPTPPAPQPEQKVEPKPEPKVESKPEIKPEPKPEKRVEPQHEKKVETREPEPEEPKAANDRFKLNDKSKIKKIERADKGEKSAPVKKSTEFDLSKTVRKTIRAESSDSSNSDEASTSKAAARAAARRAAALEQAMGAIRSGTGGSTSIDVPGPGGPAYAGYGLYLKKIYEDAWIPPVAAKDNLPIVEVEVTIAKDGRVISSRITKRSGVSSLDRSVQDALNRVKRVPAFPAGSTDEKREFRINFNLTNKLGIG